MSSEVPKFLRSGVWAKFVLQFLFPPSTEKISSRPLPRQMGKRERQASAASCYTSLKTGFFDCCYLVLFDSVLLPTQAFCSSSISAQFSNTLSPQNLILLKLPVENSDSRRIESKIPPPTQLSSSS